mmetsp:Transcript_28520/g.54422  ORF Transcript_28520/g.54422 Transcript_28520/m.54422 type:complete len:302 (+) Transcript_28520:302-1207(+)|eukprot:CAMPEP_0114234766 /NCGR_PEP_ID=MMETSP0058-20121206/5884_1 /TAXON_ID=36894 /ORGANISM="Pyramimonas parkeae, CCMP726" /LENGTH=301 /DNA_ID=CAMNT_0001346467 /DNA_START=1061 /DNA_END=1966 /DNA_ORIENTATION=+
MDANGKPKRSMFGKQHDSRKSTAAAYGFGSSNRDGAAKVFLTAEHSKADYGHESPGPVYDLKSSVGKQESSKNSTAPLFSFGTADRFHKDQAGGGKASSAPGPGTYVKPSSFGRQGESTRQTSEAFGFGSSTRLGAERVFLSPEHSKNDYGKSSPGPSVYNPKASVGQQAESHKENAPSFVFSSAERFKYEHVERAARMPGAGQYNAINSVGKQPDSKKSTLPRYSFGSSKREHRAKVYISAEHEKCSHGMASPGPALVGGKSSVGKQQSSRNVSSSSWSFGSARRFVYSESKVPGPGTYD